MPRRRRWSRTRASRSSSARARAREGLHRAYHDRAMDAYWAEGVDLSQRSALEQLAREVGVSEHGIGQALDDRIWARAVDESTRRAQAAGATGVPAFVIDRRLLVIGAQPRELLAEAVAQARARAGTTEDAAGRLIECLHAEEARC